MIFVFELTRAHTNYQPTIIEVPSELDAIAADVMPFLEEYLGQRALGYGDSFRWSTETLRREHRLNVYAQSLFLYRTDALNPVLPGETVYFEYRANGGQVAYTPRKNVWSKLPKRLADYFLREWAGERTPWVEMYQREHAARWPEGEASVQGLDRFERDIL